MTILLAVPVFNEARYVVPVMREIRKYARAAALAHGTYLRILVIDDGSTDSTPAALRDLAKRGHMDLLTHPENRGYGQSLIDAFNFASEHNYDWVITMDCDEQHEPCRIPLFVHECLKDHADIISGTRYLKHSEGGGSRDEGVPPADRRNINRIITDLLNSTLELTILPPAKDCGASAPRDREAAAATSAQAGNAMAGGRGDGDDAGGGYAEAGESGERCASGPVLTDSFCGFKAHRVSALQRMNLTIPGYAFPMQFWAQAAALGLAIQELPVKLIYKDATRHFGGLLDDPTARLHHYLQVLMSEIRAIRTRDACRERAECLME